jgi:hypothetical protein
MTNKDHSRERYHYYRDHVEVELLPRRDYSDEGVCPHNNGKSYEVCRSCTRLLPGYVCREEY